MYSGMNDGTYILAAKNGNTTFRVSGDEVFIQGAASEGDGEVVTRATARQIWAELVRGGAKRITCEDEDGHDGEACTCGERRYEPQPGTFAFTARLLAQSGLMSGDEADEWKDRMKDESMGL